MMCSFTETVLFACLIIHRTRCNFFLDKHAPMKSVQAFCPTATCSTNDTIRQSNHARNRCCVPCDCSNTCLDAGTCCMDAETKTRTYSEDEENDILVRNCVKTSTGNSNNVIFATDIDRYLLIQSCPGTERQIEFDEIRTKCLQPNNDSLDEIMPVYSNSTRRHYRNIYCAKCNNDSVNASQWETHVICESLHWLWSSVPSSATRSELVQHIRSIYGIGCFLKWKPASGNAQHCIDGEDLISYCPLHEYGKICREIYAPVRGNLGVYRNIFCLACYEDVESCFAGRQVDTIEVVLNSEVLAEKHMRNMQGSGDKQEICQKGMVFDALLRECILKACPMTYVKVDDTCQPVITKINGTRFEYLLKLLYPTTGFKLPTDDKIFSIARRLVLHNDETFAEICSEEVIGLATEGNKVVIRLKFTKHVRQPTSLYHDYRMFTNKIRDFNKRALVDGFDFSVELLDTIEYNWMLADYVSTAEFVGFRSPSACYPAIAVSNIQFCDMVILKESEYSNGSVTMSNGVTFYPGEYVLRLEKYKLETVGVCYDLYVSKIMKAKGFAISGFAEHLSIFDVYSVILLGVTLSPFHF